MESILIFLPITAISISIISLIYTLRNNKRQIRINKLEEILEINLFLLYHYEILLDIFKIQTEIRETSIKKNGLNISSLQKEEDILIDSFLEYTGKDTFTNKIIRLEVLTRSYLPNKDVKFKILSLGDLYSNLLIATLHKDYQGTRINYNNYPEISELFKYSEIIENEIIIEMKLGYKTLKSNKIETYRSKLKSDLKIS